MSTIQQQPEFAPVQPVPGKPRRWYQKKRFIIPIAVLFVFWVIGSLGGDPEASSTATPAAIAQEVEPTQSAEEREAEAAEAAEEQAAEDAAKAAKEAEEAAKKEAERVAAEQAAAAKAAEEAAKEAAKGTVSQQSAYRSAQSYLEFKGFSRSGLIGQLTSEYGEGFPAADAEFAVARLEAEGGVDWNAEAAQSAQSYLEFKGFSRQGLIEQLTSEYGEGFTQEQAEYGVSTTGL